MKQPCESNYTHRNSDFNESVELLQHKPLSWKYQNIFFLPSSLYDQHNDPEEHFIDNALSVIKLQFNLYFLIQQLNKSLIRQG